ncbi:TfuA-like protein [Streptomyces sp. NPDC088253]|uniref:TfuA-like protein n=1 Tax=Streptomyces sp. NPDC088253 TaxID=3365846 RepID=UPI0038185B73
MIAVFVGPTIPVRQVERILAGTPFLLLPPAGQGDVYRAARRRPTAIVLIDGYFHQVAAVWHKEILWALHEGIPVLGAASMGALRAAELEPFGMVGTGAIFECYRDGTLVSDDEVAVAHADASMGYRALSEPLVNIRATLARALAEDVISGPTYRAALDAAIDLPYTDRSYPAVLAKLGDGREAAALGSWLSHGRVDQKALDAEAALQSAATAGLSRPKVPWLFERTALWEQFVRVEGLRALDQHQSRDDERLEGLRADKTAFRQIAVAAVARLLAADAARRHGRAMDEEELAGKLEELRHWHGLHDTDRLDQWLAENDLSVEGLARLLAGEAHLDWVIEALPDDLDPFLLDQLRLTGSYTNSRM